MIKRLAPNELALIESLSTPNQIQLYLDQLQYDYKERCVREVIADGKAECLGGALFALACFLHHGQEASLIELWPRSDKTGQLLDEEHILCVYKQNDKFGAIAQSKFSGLKSRPPIYNSLSRLAQSYLEFYFNFQGELTLKSHTDLLPLAPYHDQWLTDNRVAQQIAHDLTNLPHTNLVSPDAPIARVSPEKYWRETQYFPPGTKIPQWLLDQKPR